MFRTIGKSKIALLLAILFGISLFFMRGGSRYSNFFNSDNIVANISGTTISTSKFSRALTLNINQFNQMLGKQMSKEEIINFQVATMSLGALINNAVFENEYDTNNFKIDDTIIAKKTKERIPGLYDINNKLNKIYLNQFLQQEKLQLEDIVQIINFETRDKFFDEAFFNISYPKIFSEQIHNYDKHFRLIKYLKIPIDLINIDDVDLMDNNNLIKNYYNENINRYMTKEQRSVEFFSIDKNDYLNDFVPSENEISNYYYENLDLYKENEKRSFIQYNFKNLEEAKKFELKIKTLNNTEDIINFSNENGIDYIEFDKLSKNEVLDEISSLLFDLEINEKSDIIQTTLANHIVILKEIISEKQLKLDEVSKIIKKTITDIDVNNYFNELIDNMSQYILNGNSIVEIKDEFNLKLERLSKITKEYNNYEQEKEILYKSLIENTFNSKKDFVNDIVKIDTDNYYIYNVTNILPSIAENFSVIEKKVINDWKNIKKIEKIELLISNNKSKQNFINQLSKKYNIEYQELKINKNEKNLPKILINEIFNNKNKNENISVTNKTNIHIANIKDILIDNESFEKISSISLMRDIKGSFGEELLKKVDIKTNENLINAIIDKY